MIGIPLLPQKLSARWTVETKQDLDAYTSMDDDILLEKALDELIKGM
jgi:spore coat polysaccharide biosynthesis protein SpsF (cytidylyltransferase family)